MAKKKEPQYEQESLQDQLNRQAREAMADPQDPTLPVKPKRKPAAKRKRKKA